MKDFAIRVRSRETEYSLGSDMDRVCGEYLALLERNKCLIEHLSRRPERMVPFSVIDATIKRCPKGDLLWRVCNDLVAEWRFLDDLIRKIT